MAKTATARKDHLKVSETVSPEQADLEPLPPPPSLVEKIEALEPLPVIDWSRGRYLPMLFPKAFKKDSEAVFLQDARMEGLGAREVAVEASKAKWIVQRLHRLRIDFELFGPEGDVLRALGSEAEAYRAVDAGIKAEEDFIRETWRYSMHPDRDMPIIAMPSVPQIPREAAE